MIAMQLLLSVDLMNRMRIVHRDLKPENLLINLNDKIAAPQNTEE